MSRRQKNDLKQLTKRDVRDLRSVACAVMGIPFGPVEVANRPYQDREGRTIQPEDGELMDVVKVQGNFLVERTVTVRWEMTDNRAALLRYAM